MTWLLGMYGRGLMSPYLTIQNTAYLHMPYTTQDKALFAHVLHLTQHTYYPRLLNSAWKRFVNTGTRYLGSLTRIVRIALRFWKTQAATQAEGGPPPLDDMHHQRILPLVHSRISVEF